MYCINSITNIKRIQLIFVPKMGNITAILDGIFFVRKEKNCARFCVILDYKLCGIAAPFPWDA
jgi:hypothetical protein